MNLRVTQLRSLLAARFPGALQPGLGEDAAPYLQTSAGLLPGKLVEIVASPGCGGEGLLLRRFCAEASGPLALVDGADAFDPALAAPDVRQRLLWLRCRRATEAVRAADLVLRDGNLPTVLVDLRLLPMRELLRLPSSVWHRLRMLAERANAAVAIFSPCRVVPCAVRRWEMEATLGLEALEEPSESLAGRLHPHPRGAGRQALAESATESLAISS